MPVQKRLETYWRHHVYIYIYVEMIDCIESDSIYIYIYIYIYTSVSDNGPGEWGSIPGRVIPKTPKMELDDALLNTQLYKVRIKGKVQQSRERRSAHPYSSV